MEKPTFKLSRVKGAPVSNLELLSDLKKVAKQLDLSTVPQKKYGDLGAYDCSTLIRRFGSWNKALSAAGLGRSNEIDISDTQLFENLFILWQHYGRQPRRSELAKAPSIISQSPYNRRFGSWTKALEAFVNYANSSRLESAKTVMGDINTGTVKANRDPSLRLRWKVLQRDHFTCCKCGASPAIKIGVELHVDHIIPWSKNGETSMDNLQTLCSKCNLGKSDLSTGNL